MFLVLSLGLDSNEGTRFERNSELFQLLDGVHCRGGVPAFHRPVFVDFPGGLECVGQRDGFHGLFFCFGSLDFDVSGASAPVWLEATAFEPM